MLKLVDMVALGLILSARELDEVGGAIDIIEMVPPRFDQNPAARANSVANRSSARSMLGTAVQSIPGHSSNFRQTAALGGGPMGGNAQLPPGESLIINSQSRSRHQEKW